MALDKAGCEQILIQDVPSDEKWTAIRDRLFAFTLQAEDLPQAGNRVDLDPTVVDAWGFAAGRVTSVGMTNMAW